ncbi:MAG: RsmB/NOP family class I SAM-dependent RNA methyltransferase [Xanthobacteraceae bacterium]|nr:RsmB/NOP family class I SAM-dependent RNA methyltransferase [Xanthobacteraceae bacterium]
MARAEQSRASDTPGLATRRIAAELLEAVLVRGRPLDEQLEAPQARRGLDPLAERDRALVRHIVATVLRRLGTLRRLIGDRLARGLPPEAPRVETALLIGAAQILFLEVPDHAAVDLSVRLVQADRRDARYAGLVNGLLRRIARERYAVAALEPLDLDTPEWLLARWSRTYGAETAHAVALANRSEPPLDLTVKADSERWAATLGGIVMPTGTVRLAAPGPVAALPGYGEGAWWVQDAAAALPTRLFGDLYGRTVADLCAAPGGKTAQLAVAGGAVTAIDRAESRMARLSENLGRLGLAAHQVVAAAEDWQGGPFDAVLIDAPCTSTGTIRRHPDIPWRRAPADVTALTALQRRLLDNAIRLARPGGTIVFCTCSLEPEEGEEIIRAALAQDERIARHPLALGELPVLDGFVTADGDLRTLPCQWPHPDPRLAGLDGFYAARLRRL